MSRLLIATNNPGKYREYQSILQEILPDWTFLTLREAGITHDVNETGRTFDENARLKARAYGALSGLPVISDDSGLVVEALGGFPGVQSHRWAGPTATVEDRNAQLLARMAGVPAHKRGARFVCVALYRTPAGQEVAALGEVVGEIGHEPRGQGGFGYDPIFVLPERGLTLAELSSEEKNAISHRGRAARALAPKLRAILV